MSSIIYNGHEIQDLIVNGNQAQLWLNGQKLYPTGGTPVDPYNPLGLPLYTMRLKFAPGEDPSGASSYSLVDAEENIWDCTGNGTQVDRLPICASNTNLIEVISVNMRTTDGFHSGMATRFQYASNLVAVSIPCMDHITDMNKMFFNCTSLTSVTLIDPSSCTNMKSMFESCSSLTSVPLFVTSSCTNMERMFASCTSLSTVPLFDTSSCTNMTNMFNGCVNVQSGALALYQQASTQATPPTSHRNTFKDCGRDTVTGAAELAQIPTDWGGTYEPVSETYTVEFSFPEYPDFPGANFHVTSSSVSSSLQFYYQSSIGGSWVSLSSSEASDIINGTSNRSGYGLKIEGIPSWTQFVLEATNEMPSLEELEMAATIKVTSSTRGVILNDSDSWSTLGMFGSVTVNIDSNMSTTWTWVDALPDEIPV